MTIRKLFFALALPLVVMSCGGGVKHISDMEIRDSLIYANGQPYSGEVWSDDEHDYRLTTQDGILVNCRLYHSNDSVAIEILNDSIVTYYNDNGEVLLEDTFKVRYKEICATLADLMSAIRP